MSGIAEGIIHTPEGVDPLEDHAYYTLAWKNLEDMKAIFQTTSFDKPQLCLEDKHGAVVKEPHGDGCSKPNGLYLAPGRSWIDFAYREERWQFYKQYLYKVELNDGLKLFPLNNHDQAIRFAKLYGIEEDGAINTIHWNNVAVDFHGISVLNWEKSDNPLLNWYNTFEAPQVVIWKAKANNLVFTLVADTKNEAHPKIFKSPPSPPPKTSRPARRRCDNCNILGGKGNSCKTRCNKKYNPKKAKKINFHVALELWECVQTCKSKKKTKEKEKMQNKSRNRKKRTRRNTSRRVRYSRKKRRHSQK